MAEQQQQIDFSKVVGELYIESYHRLGLVEQKYQNIITDLRRQVSTLESENTMLKKVLEKASGAEQPKTTLPGIGS